MENEKVPLRVERSDETPSKKGPQDNPTENATVSRKRAKTAEVPVISQLNSDSETEDDANKGKTQNTANQDDDFFTAKTDPWVNSKAWGTCRVGWILGNKHKSAVHLNLTKGLDCLPFSNPKDLGVYTEITITTSFGETVWGPYERAVINCAEDYYDDLEELGSVDYFTTGPDNNKVII